VYHDIQFVTSDDSVLNFGYARERTDLDLPIV